MEPTDGDAAGLPRPVSHGPEPVDEARVAALRAAVQSGALRSDAQLIAVRLLGWERLLTRT